MVVLGIDAASRSGIAHLSSGNVLALEVWEANKHASIQQNLRRFYNHLETYHQRCPVECVVVERLAVVRNQTTVRILHYYEAMAVLKAAEWRADLEQIVVSSARKAVFGKGNIKKEDVYDKLRKEYKDQKWLPYDKGGNDQSDALTYAIYGERYRN